MSKKKIREKFRTDVFSRDKNTCKVCSTLVYESKVYYGWDTKEDRLQIIKDIRNKTIELLEAQENEDRKNLLNPN